jgi:hypothetical protein
VPGLHAEQADGQKTAPALNVGTGKPSSKGSAI